MKKRMNSIIGILIALFMTAAVNAYAGETSLRERLVEADTVRLLYAVDDFHTFVVGEHPALSGAEADFTVVSRYDEKDFKAYLIKHRDAQPFVYKNPVVPSYEEISMPESGEMVLSAAGEKGAYTGLDLFQHMSALCRKNNGTPAFVIPKKYGRFGRLTNVDAVEEFNYILSSGAGDNAWFIGCDGKDKFMVEKNYQSLAGGRNTADFYANRGLENVNFVKTAPANIGQPTPVATQASPADQAKFREQMAFEVSSVKADFVKPYGGEKYTGTFNGTYKSGCDLVSIKKVAARETTVKLYEFKVCQDKVAALGVKDIQVNPGNIGNMFAGKN